MENDRFVTCFLKKTNELYSTGANDSRHDNASFHIRKVESSPLCAPGCVDFILDVVGWDEGFGMDCIYLDFNLLRVEFVTNGEEVITDC